MNPAKKFWSLLNQQVTIMVIPHRDLPVLRRSFSAAFMLFLLALWTGITLWAAFKAGRHVDYWVTKADNLVIRGKMTYMAEEMSRWREMLEMARATDKQMRILLGLGSRERVLGTDEALGGPNASDKKVLRKLLAGDLTGVSDALVRRSVEDLRRESERRLASFQEISWHIANERSLFRSTPSLWPAAGHISSGFGYRFSPVNLSDDGVFKHFHEGVDIANKPDTPIVATADGVVRYTGWFSGYGVMVLIDHGFGFSTVYAHVSKATVKEGGRVVRGQLVAYMGTSGRSTGNHVHYEVWRHGRPANPTSYLDMRLDAQEPPS
jgi:murein DD-endopeptidase MepM/ murein hydrolase activator NlpD